MPLGMKCTRAGGRRQMSSAIRSSVREGTATVARRSTSRRVHTRRGNCRARSSGPKPSSI